MKSNCIRIVKKSNHPIHDNVFIVSGASTWSPEYWDGERIEGCSRTGYSDEYFTSERSKTGEDYIRGIF
jgi:hypothetical protein